jgi:hypothetical protein
MKDRTNREKPVLEPTIKWLQSMSESIASLHKEVYPESPLWFAIMAQGPVDQIRDLLDDIEWLMEDMIPQELRAQAAQLREFEETAAIATQEAA